MTADDTADRARERLAFQPIDGAWPPAPNDDGSSSVPAPAEHPHDAPASSTHIPPTLPPSQDHGSDAGVGRLAAWRAAISGQLDREAERGGGFLLVPVIFGAGAATNFTMPSEPPVAVGLALAAAAFAGMFMAGQRLGLRIAMVALLVFMLGMLAASLETLRAGTTMLGSEITTRLTGRVVTIEHRSERPTRITLDVIATERPTLRHAPERIRVSARTVPEGLAPGDTVAGLIRLLPPTGPVRPDSYDFSFESYFDRVGAAGFFLSGPFPRDTGSAETLAERFATRVEALRQSLAAHIRQRIGGSEGEIAAALVAGVRSGIPEAENEALRRTGLYHIISISGLHMALVAGTVLGGFRGAFALFPGFASRFPVKKFAAGAALLALCLYLLISGAEVAAQRSFIMFAVMLVAVMFDRSALTMRNLAISALIILAIAPHEVLGPSFQMSFAATAALIAGYAWYAERRRTGGTAGGQDGGLLLRLTRMGLLFFAGLAATSILAGAATGLYAAWHFQRAAPLGLVANLAASPFVSVAVMPMAVVGTVLIPFGLDGPFFAVMGKGLTAVIAIAEWLSARSPVDEVGLIPKEAVVLASVGLVILTVASTRLRLASLPILAFAGVLIMLRDMPDALVAEDGRLVAMRMADERLAVNRARPSAFTNENWSRALLGRGIIKPGVEDTAPETGEQPFVCDNGLCIGRHESGAAIGFATKADEAGPACAKVALLVVDDATAENVCPAGSAATIITKRDLARKGSAAIHFTRDGKIESLRFAIGDPVRPWHDQRRFSREARGLAPYQRKPGPEKQSAGQQARPTETGKSGGTEENAQ